MVNKLSLSLSLSLSLGSQFMLLRSSALRTASHVVQRVVNQKALVTVHISAK